MASRRFLRPIWTPLLLGAAKASSNFLTSSDIRRPIATADPKTAAQVQFSTSSRHAAPVGWTGRIWQIRNDYPKPTNMEPAVTVASHLPPGSRAAAEPEAPWLSLDFRSNPLAYCVVIKNYCWEGNVENGFVVQNNPIRDWYHAPWLHWGDEGREPLNGLTWERPKPIREISRTRNPQLQLWACGYYNRIGASVFGKIWNDPDNPKWDADLQFPLGTCVFKILLTDATDSEIPIMAGAPALKAVIAADGNPRTRNDFASDVHLLQVDFAVRDDRSPTGWVFGTFMYNGNQRDANPWDRLTPVGLMWGNDPTMNQVAYEAGAKPAESWINPEAEQIRISFGGERPSWGWNGRLNGPADNFISSCLSCHSVAQKNGSSGIIPPRPHKVGNKYIPNNDSITMRWFRNIPSGQPFDTGAISGDYSLQLAAGYHNYQNWYNTTQRTAIGWFLRNGVFAPGRAFGFVERGSKK